MTKIRNITFPYPAVLASGADSFFGKEYQQDYPHHSMLKLVPGFSFKNTTFCAKTVTAEMRAGNTKTTDNAATFVEFWPDSVGVTLRSFGKAAAVNAIGLTNPGITNVVQEGFWQQRTEPFMISFMSLKTDVEGIKEEVEVFIYNLSLHMAGFNAPFAIQVNLSCPNTGHDISGYLDNAGFILERLSELQVPLIPKISIGTSWNFVDFLCKTEYVDAICVSNTQSWETFSAEEQKYWFGTTTSPVAKYGGGGVSGRPLLDDILEWLDEYEIRGYTKDIIQSGGITRLEDVDVIAAFKAVKMISIGSVAIVRPWRVQKIIQRINQLLTSKK
jgi:dihydroorotate dehydrogenase